MFTFREEDGLFIFSLPWTIVNMSVTTAGQLALFAVLNKGRGWDWDWNWYEVTGYLGFSLLFALTLLIMTCCYNGTPSYLESKKFRAKNLKSAQRSVQIQPRF